MPDAGEREKPKLAGDAEASGRAARRVFGPITLGLFMFGFIANINGMPSLAEYGLGSIFFYALAAIFLLAPTGIVTAELAAGWPRTGGIYEWTRLAFGPKIGFFVIWLEWFNFVIAFPAIVTLLASQIAFAIEPSLSENKLFVVSVVVVAVWSSTWVAARGVRLARDLNALGVILGTAVPALVLIVLAVVWLADGNPSAMSLAPSTIVPDFSNATHLVFAIQAFLMFSGIEVAAVHAGDVRRPERSFPRGTLVAGALAILIFPLATLAVALVVPQAKLNVVTGLVQAFDYFLARLGVEWMLIPMVAFLSVGLVVWFVQVLGGPSRGLMMAGRHGSLPAFMGRANSRGMPVGILLVQAIIDTGLVLVYVLANSVQQAWWILMAVQTQVVLIMYIVMYLAAIRLRRSHPDVDRPFRAPGGAVGLMAICGVGILMAVVVISLGFLPPPQLGKTPIGLYVGSMLVGVLIICAAPFVIGAVTLFARTRRAGSGAGTD